MKESFKEVNKLFLVGCGIVILAVIAMVVMVLVNDGNKGKQLVCQSNNGNITLYYSSETVHGYTSDGYAYDLLSEQSRAEQMGVDAYIKEYSGFFAANTMGTCTIQK